MATYTLHLGFNWNSPLIGSVWSSEGALTGDDRFVQYALADESGAPAWFQLAVNDVLNIEIWDLSSTRDGSLVLALDMSFGPLDAGNTQTYDPSTYVDSQGNATVRRQSVNGKPQYYLSFDTIQTTPGETCPWGGFRGHFSTGPVTLTSAGSYKLSFCLQATPSGSGADSKRTFISDPEVIVGSRGA